ncbi:MAG TPA: diguanylate cyclase [Rhodocyclaceae bacterium]
MRPSSISCWFFVCMLVLGGLWRGIALADDVALDHYSPGMVLGRHLAYLQESGAPSTLEGVRAAWRAGRFTPAASSIPAFGIGSPPVWLRFAVVNNSDQKESRQIRIENPWLDRLDIYIVGKDQVPRHVRLGDTLPANTRPIPGRFFAAEHSFDSGLTEIYFRVETPDPIVIPAFFMTEAESERRDLQQGYGYGFIYGYLAALLIYNLVLFVNLRNRIYLRYSSFLGAFLLLNLAYTGHGFAWLWPNQVVLQQWIIPVTMVLFGIAELRFAQAFLDTATRLPHWHRGLSAIAGSVLFLLIMATLISGNQRDALLVGFVFVTVFTLLMPLLGLAALRSGHAYARYFLAATLASMSGALVTALATWGFIPFNDWTFRAVEAGMLVDATVLALALGRQFRALKAEQMLAELRATRDPLTNLYNRRAFLDIAQPQWWESRRSGRDLALIMVDLDHFKSINDILGHGAGDAALVEAARVLAGAVRQGDVVARWGGEEFLLLLPNTGIEAAVALAERLRQQVAEIRLRHGEAELTFTASFGVVLQTRQESLDHLITDVDACLYRAKRQGRNRACFDPGPLGATASRAG